MALDEPKDTDSNYEIDGFQYIIDTDFLEKAKSITVDFQQYGFKITAGVEFGGGACGSCSTASGGSCG